MKRAERRAGSGSKLFDIMILFLKEIFEKVNFEKKSADDKKARKIPVGKVFMNSCQWWNQYKRKFWIHNYTLQWRNQNAEKVTHIKGRLMDQSVVLFNRVPFQIVNFFYRKEFAPRGGEFFPLRAVPYGIEHHFYHTWWPPLNITIFHYARA